MITVSAFFKDVKKRLSSAFGDTAEGEAAARIIFEDMAGYDRKFIFINGDREVSDFVCSKVIAVVEKVEQGMPVQYAVGKARFMGKDFVVSPAVLIPRRETEGLVDIIVEENSSTKDLRILDIGTGTGCIALSLARILPFSRVSAIDISAEALAVARDNAKLQGLDVVFSQCDILQASYTSAPSFDIIVSNPPYVAESEKKEMDSRVYDYEPASALFVPDSEPLIYYRAIAHYARKALLPGGKLYFEINSAYPRQMRQLLEREGFEHVDIVRDYRGLYRYVKAVQP
ncbi:MAG: peptide chain release factor N(5)-glutamine methyltransferase [Muribaculaceae bacterium]|nr:peptide chain release factor N(5)-glutamine methyltransferase [Muribaculaceae bacterium]